MAPNDEKALANVMELFKTIIGTSGVMLALLWGLSKGTEVIWIIRLSSVILVLAITMSLVGGMFIVTQLENDTARVTRTKTVAASYVIAWISFIFGCGFVIWAIFTLQPSSLPPLLGV